MNCIHPIRPHLSTDDFPGAGSGNEQNARRTMRPLLPKAVRRLRLSSTWRLSLGSGTTRVDVLKGITLNFERGKATAIIGPSGCGKSTLLGARGPGARRFGFDHDRRATESKASTKMHWPPSGAKGRDRLPVLPSNANDDGARKRTIPLGLAGVRPFRSRDVRWKWLTCLARITFIPLNSQVANSSAYYSESARQRSRTRAYGRTDGESR